MVRSIPAITVDMREINSISALVGTTKRSITYIYAHSKIARGSFTDLTSLPVIFIDSKQGHWLNPNMKLTNTSETQGEKPYHRRSVDASSREFSYSPERLYSFMKIATSPSEVGHNKQSYHKTSAGRTPSRAPGNYNHLSERAPKNAFDLYCKDMRSVLAKRHTKEIADGSFDIEGSLARGWSAMDEEGRAEFLRKFEQVKKAAEVKKQGGAGGGGARQTPFDAGSRNADEDVEIAEERGDVDTLSYTEMNSPWHSSGSDSEYSTRDDEPRNPMDKFAETFKKMEGKAWKSSAKISGISSTISKDNTSGECARRAKLFAEFGKRRPCAFASSFAQH
jgi:hypothetical protein